MSVELVTQKELESGSGCQFQIMQLSDWETLPMNRVTRMTQYSTPKSIKCDLTLPVYISPPQSSEMPASITTIWWSVIVQILLGNSKVVGPLTSLDAMLLESVVDEG